MTDQTPKKTWLAYVFQRHVEDRRALEVNPAQNPDYCLGQECAWGSLKALVETLECRGGEIVAYLNADTTERTERLAEAVGSIRHFLENMPDSIQAERDLSQHAKFTIPDDGGNPVTFFTELREKTNNGEHFNLGFWHTIEFAMRYLNTHHINSSFAMTEAAMRDETAMRTHAEICWRVFGWAMDRVSEMIAQNPLDKILAPDRNIDDCGLKKSPGIERYREMTSAQYTQQRARSSFKLQ